MINFLKDVDTTLLAKDTSYVEVIGQLYYPAQKYLEEQKRIIDYTDKFCYDIDTLRFCTHNYFVTKNKNLIFSFESLYEEACLLFKTSASNIDDKTDFSKRDIEFTWPLLINSRFYLLTLSGGKWLLFSKEKLKISEKFLDVHSLLNLFKVKSDIVGELSQTFSHIENKKILKKKVASLK